MLCLQLALSYMCLFELTFATYLSTIFFWGLTFFEIKLVEFNGSHVRLAAFFFPKISKW